MYLSSLLYFIKRKFIKKELTPFIEDYKNTVAQNKPILATFEGNLNCIDIKDEYIKVMDQICTSLKDNTK